MSRMTANCQNCGSPKQQGEFANLYCSDCFAAIAGAEAKAMAENTDTAAARREALAARAHTAHRNFTDPRILDRKTIWLTGNRPSEGAPDAS